MISKIKKLEWLPLLLARLAIGLWYVSIGWGKMAFMLHSVSPHAHLFGWVIAACNILGGVLMVVGSWTRTAALILLFIFGLHHFPHLMQVRREEVFHTALFSILLLGLIIQGPGAVSIDK